MKTIIRNVEALQSCLEEVVAKRGEAFDNRTEKWQESEKGEAYKEQTDRLQEMLDDVSDWAYELGDSI